MLRYPTFRATINDLLSLSITDLKRHGLMIGCVTQYLVWPKQEIRIHLWVRSMGFDYNKLVIDDFVEFTYSYQGEPVCYRIKLVTVNSNLPKGGQVWYFVCPVTGKRCRKLYRDGKYFVSRFTLNNRLYESQTHSKSYRFIESMYGPEVQLDDLRDAIERPYVKHHYRGTPTKLLKKYYSISKVVESRRQAGIPSLNDVYLSYLTTLPNE